MSASTVALSKAEISSVESQIDQEFEKSELPCSSSLDSRRVSVMVMEDVFRFMIQYSSQIALSAPDIRSNMVKIVTVLDKYKYNLRNAIHLIDRCQSNTIYENTKIDERSYLVANELVMERADAFSSATRILSSVHAGLRGLERRSSDNHILITDHPEDKSYPSLEFLQNAEDDNFSAIQYLFLIFKGKKFILPNFDNKFEWSPEIRKIVERTKRFKDQVRYTFITNVARSLLQTFEAATLPTLEAWQFPWGDNEISRKILLALHVRVFYHLVAIHFGASKLNIKGVGVDQICLETTIGALTIELARVTNIDEAVVRLVVQHLTYGFKTSSPDPALQPIIPIGNGQFILSGLLILSSAWHRNMLALHARIDARSFDAQSSIFEKTMLIKVTERIPANFKFDTSVFISTSQGKEEVDVLLVDESSKTIMVCELRWMLQPGDAKEVVTRQKEIQRKVKQAERKRDAIRSDLNLLKKLLDVRIDSTWSCQSIVIIDGYAGTVSKSPKTTPVVPRKIFGIAINRSRSLAKTHALFSTSMWLPREPGDITRDRYVIEMGGEKFDVPVFNIGPERYMSDSLPRYLAQADTMSVDQLTALPWLSQTK